ncbi:DUF4186 domain-containing protein [Dankookia rubra]|uniref:DUF4186 domain-containing protein n=1 Tax=Dankookia rubra TaxID=1442381 RepID=A0A4V3A9F2_9PROT|nr:DUF4186 domain-containing protein [Dankookia rubra]
MADLDDVFARLARSAFRQRFTLAKREREYIRVRGKETVMAHARVFIAQRLAPAHPANDGKQTPFRGHPAFLAQHATATCCRGCLAKWHGIPAGRVLTANEQAHVVSAIERWLDMQVAGNRSGVQQSLQLL